MKEPNRMTTPVRNAKMGLVVTFICLVAILSLTPLLNAQSFFGSVVGIVTDTSGAAIAEATVTVTNVGTSEAVKVQTDAGGKYSVVNLVPADYNVTVEKANFKRFVRERAPVQVGATTRVDVSLAVGNATETVEVSTAAPLLQTDSSSLSQEVEGAQVQEMPLNGRNVMNLIALAPGVIPGGSSQGDTGLAQGTRSNNASFNNYQIGGGIGGEGAQFIDGAPNSLLGGNLAGLVPTQDGIQEFNVVSSNANADFGRYSGGVVNMTTKSGTNAFHGSVYEYFRNTDLNANDWFHNNLSQPRAKWNQNQYGAAVSGPIKRDRAFFMFTWEGFNLLEGDLVPTNVPTQAMQDGVFGTFPATQTVKPDPLGACDVEPYTGQTVNGHTYASGGQYIANLYQPALTNSNGITTCGDPLNAILKTFYPLPTAATTGATNNWYYTTPLKNTQNQYNGRVDYQLGSKQRLFGRYTYWSLEDSAHSEFLDHGSPAWGSTAAVTWPTNDSKVGIFTHQAVVGDTVTLNSSTVLDVRASYMRVTYPDPTQSSSINESQFGADYAALSPQMSKHVLPAPNPSGSDGIYSFKNVGNFSEYWYNTYTLGADLVKILGSHSIKVGTDLRLYDSSATGFPSGYSGAYAYSNGFVGDEWAAFLMGYPTQVQFQTLHIPAAYSYYQAYYVADTWQAARNLTVNLGLRYELPGAISERNNRNTVLLPSTLDPVTGITGTLGLVDGSLYKSRADQPLKYGSFAPRVGIAYRATANTVFHAGYGISYLPNDLSGLGGAGVMPFASPINLQSTTKNITSATQLQTPLGCYAGTISLSSTGCTALNITQTGIVPTQGRNPNFMSLLASTNNYLGQAVASADPYSYRETPSGPVFSKSPKPYPWVQQWNLAVSHEFKGDFMAEVSYSGLHGQNMPGMGAAYPGVYGLDELIPTSGELAQAYSGSYASGSKEGQGLSQITANCANENNEMMSIGQCDRPFPYYNNFEDTDALLAHQNYASFQVSGEKRFKSAGVIKGFYSWARNLDNADTETGNIEKGGAVQGVAAITEPQDFNNPNGEYSIVTFNVKNRIVVDYLLNLPFGKGQKYANDLGDFGNSIVSGWSIDGITTFQTGFPIWLVTANANQLTQNFGAGQLRPSVVPGCNKKIAGGGASRVGPKALGAWFNTSCFVYPSSSGDPLGLYTFGNEPRVDPDLNADGVKNFDLSMQKSTPIRESVSFVFRAEFFNIFNRVQFAPPFPKEGANNFGQVSYQVNTPRQIQLSARVNF